jgi:hypothetical protein
MACGIINNRHKYLYNNYIKQALHLFICLGEYLRNKENNWQETRQETEAQHQHWETQRPHQETQHQRQEIQRQW